MAAWLFLNLLALLLWKDASGMRISILLGQAEVGQLFHHVNPFLNVEQLFKLTTLLTKGARKRFRKL